MQSTAFWLAACALGALAAVASPAAAQAGPDPAEPMSFPEFMGEQVREFGSHLDERNRLAREREQQIRTLTSELQACGNCAERAELQGRLDHWKSLDQLVNEAEHTALKTMGLGEFRNIDELGVGLLQRLAIGSQQVEQQRERDRAIGDLAIMIGYECKKKFAIAPNPNCPGRPPRRELQTEFHRKVDACTRENDPLRLYANDQMIRELCGKLPNASACIASNSLVERARTYNQQAAADDREARLKQRQAAQVEDERRREAAIAKRKQDRIERTIRRTKEERIELQRQEREARRAEVAERKRLQLECNG